MNSFYTDPHQGEPIPPSRRRSTPAAVVLLLGLTSALACTLTTEDYAPGVVDTDETSVSPVEPDPSTPNAGDASEDPIGEGGSGGAEDPTSSENRSPSELDDSSGGTDTDDGQTDTSNLDGTRTDAGSVGDDAVGEPEDTEPSAPDAGAPPPEPEEPQVPEEPEPEPPPEPEPEPDCPGVVFEDSCYQLFNEGVAWRVAEDRCVAWGGHLAIIESFAEDDFLSGWPSWLGLGVDGSGVWIGGVDANFNGQFFWADGSPVVLNGWSPGQPNNGPGNNCIEKRNDGTNDWFDILCTDQLRYLCEQPLF